MPFLIRFFSLMLLVSPAFALSLGEMSVKSQFGQPLEAEIEIPLYEPDELEGLTLKLADKKVFEDSGVEWTSTLNDLRFQLRRPRSGQVPVIQVTTASGLRELALSFFLEATWSGGSLVRGYDVLLTPVESRHATTDTTTSALVSQNAIQNSGTITTLGEQTLPRVVDTVPVPGTSQLNYGPVASGEILGVIARKMIPSRDHSLQQVMVAIFEQNKHAFRNQNINQLEPGYMLNLQNEASVSTVNHIQALDLIEQHTRQWHGQELAAAEEVSVAANDSGGLFRIEEVDAPPKNLEILSPGKTQIVGDGQIEPTEVESLRRELTVTLEAAEELKKKNDELKSRVTMLEELIAQRMAQLMPEKAALLNLGEKTSIIDKSSEVYRDDLVRSTSDISVSEDQESYFSEIMGVVLLVVGGIIIYLLYRQRQQGLSVDGMGETSFLEGLKKRFKRKSNEVTLRI